MVAKRHRFRRIRNLWGYLLGYGSCNRCGWTMNHPYEDFHHTDYTDSAGCSALCELCWQELGSPTARWPFYAEQMATWEEQGPIYNGVHARDLAKLVWEAVMAGG